MRTRASPPSAGTGRVSLTRMYVCVESWLRTPPVRATAAPTTSNSSGFPVARSLTLSLLATLPLRIGLKK